MDSKRFKAGFAVLCKYLGHDITQDEDLIKLYWGALKHLTDGQFETAFQVLRDTFRPTSAVPFPVIADFLSACGQSTDQRAARITQELRTAISRHGGYESVDLGDLALHATIERLGGWPRICDWTHRDWDFKGRQFMEAYKSALLTPDIGPAYLMGTFEEQNRRDGYTERIPKPKRCLLTSTDRKRLCSGG